MGSLPKGVPYFPTSDHRNLLQQVIDGSEIEKLLVRSYKRSFNGFAAILNDQQRKKLASMNGVVSIFPSEEFHIETTRSWDFLGLRQSIKRDQIMETDLVIGVIDSGIWPESESFNDKGTHIYISSLWQSNYFIIVCCCFFHSCCIYKIFTRLKMIHD